MAEEPENKGGAIKSPQDLIGGIAAGAYGRRLCRDVEARLDARVLLRRRHRAAPFLLAPRLLSVLIIVSSFTTAGRSWRTCPGGPVFILASVVFFGLSIRTLGLAITGVITVLLSGLAVEDFKIGEGLIFAVAITAFCAFSLSLRPRPADPAVADLHPLSRGR